MEEAQRGRDVGEIKMNGSANATLAKELGYEESKGLFEGQLGGTEKAGRP